MKDRIRFRTCRILHGRTAPLVCALVLLAWTGLAGPVRAQDSGIESLRKTGKAFTSVAKKVSPAVVFIQVEKTVQSQPMVHFFTPFGGGEGDPFGDELFRRFFGAPSPRNRESRPQQQRQVVGQGSGFITSAEGYILTNNHVVGDADKVDVTLQDGLTVQTLTRELAEQYDLQGEIGVLVTQVQPGSVAASAGFKPGVLIREVNRKPVKSADEFKQAIEQTPEHGTVLMLVKDGQYSRYVAIRTGK